MITGVRLEIKWTTRGCHPPLQSSSVWGWVSSPKRARRTLTLNMARGAEGTDQTRATRVLAPSASELRSTHLLVSMEPGHFGQVTAAMGKGLPTADPVDHPPQTWAERAADHPQVLVLEEATNAAVWAAVGGAADRAQDGVDCLLTEVCELCEVASTAVHPAAAVPRDDGGRTRSRTWGLYRVRVAL